MSDRWLPGQPLTGLPALTLWPEWLPCFYALGALNKRTENRGWPPPEKYIGGDLVLHAGASIGGGSWPQVQWLIDVARDVGIGIKIHRGAAPMLFVDTASRAELAELAAAARSEDVAFVGHPIPLASAVCVVRLVGADREHRTPWDMPDAWHWRVDDVRMIDPPVPMVGHQGLWRIP